MSTAASHPPVMHPRVTREQTADDIRWDCDGPAPWPDRRAVLGLAIEVLPHVAGDDLSRRLVERLALTIADLQAETRALRETLAAATNMAHAQHVEIRRLRERRSPRSAAG